MRRFIVLALILIAGFAGWNAYESHKVRAIAEAQRTEQQEKEAWEKKRDFNVSQRITAQQAKVWYRDIHTKSAQEELARINMEIYGTTQPSDDADPLPQR